MAGSNAAYCANLTVAGNRVLSPPSVNVWDTNVCGSIFWTTQANGCWTFLCWIGSYAEWSAETIAALSKSPRLRYAGAFLNFAKAISATDRAGGRLHNPSGTCFVSRDAIEACRTQLGLRYLQPGRFLCPGQSGDAPFMWFFPLPDNSEPLPAEFSGISPA